MGILDTFHVYTIYPLYRVTHIKLKRVLESFYVIAQRKILNFIRYHFIWVTL